MPTAQTQPYGGDGRGQNNALAATPIEDALARTVEDHRASERTGRENGPDRDGEERVLAVLDTL